MRAPIKVTRTWYRAANANALAWSVWYGAISRNDTQSITANMHPRPALTTLVGTKGRMLKILSEKESVR